MPIYEYRCTTCDSQFELIQKITEAAIKHCPSCKSETAERLISSVGFQLKGTGWYVTDFKNKGKVATNSTSDDKKPVESSAPKDTAAKTSTNSKSEQQ